MSPPIPSKDLVMAVTTRQIEKERRAMCAARLARRAENSPATPSGEVVKAPEARTRRAPSQTAQAH